MNDYYIVTGTTSGIGLAFINQLSKNNKTKIYSISRKENKYITNLKDKYKIKHYNCDLSDSKRLIETIKTIFDKINIEEINTITLINNAGTVNPIGDIGNKNTKAIINNIDTNLKAPILLTEFFVNKTQNINKPKYILNISSGAGRKPYAGWGTYCATKAGLDLFTSCVGIEQETKKHPIKIISFAPGVVDTNMQINIRSTKEEDFKAVKRFINLKNNNQLLSPEFVSQKLLKLLPSKLTANGKLYDIRDFIEEKQH